MTHEEKENGLWKIEREEYVQGIEQLSLYIFMVL